VSDEGEVSEAERLVDGLLDQTLVNTSPDELRDFLENWVDGDIDEEDAEEFLDFEGVSPRPEEVIESIEDAFEEYDAVEVVEAAEDLAERDWQEAPEFSGTGTIEPRTLGEKTTFPRQKEFYDLSGEYNGELVFQEDGKRVYLVDYQGENSFYEVSIDVLDEEEFLEVFRELERLNPTYGGVEVLYGDEDIFVPPGEVLEYFENRGELDDEREVYFVGLVSSNSNIDFMRADTKAQDSEMYRLEMTVGGRDTYDLDVLDPLFSEQMVKGLKTSLMLGER
jgi:hypothetical protein